jgi:SAM-dependent methyltransferase
MVMIPPVLASEALLKFMSLCNKESIILDIGAGENTPHANIMKSEGLNVKTNDLFDNADYIGFYTDIEFSQQFDAIWCSHVLEHILDVNTFLLKIKNDIKEGGMLAITVPPLKHEIVSGHVNLYNAGILLYQLIMAGFDCKNAMIKEYGYNISVILPVKKLDKIPHINSHLDSLKEYFPVEAYQGFNGDIKEHSWM